MKSTSSILIGFLFGFINCAALATIYFFTCPQAPERKYQFNTGADGQIIWQCNLESGEVKTFTSYSPASNYELLKGVSRDFLINKQTGQTWRYYQNDSNSIPIEGFNPLPHIVPESISDFLSSQTNQVK
jgi:hypothetical protein